MQKILHRFSLLAAALLFAALLSSIAALLHQALAIYLLHSF